MTDHKHLRELAECVGKSEKLIYKCADPDEEQEIPLRDAIKLDALCLERKGFAPFAELLQHLAENGPHPRTGRAFGLNEAVLHIQAALGHLAGATAAALAEHKSASWNSGKKLKPQDLQALMIAVDEMDRSLDETRRAISAESRK